MSRTAFVVSGSARWPRISLSVSRIISTPAFRMKAEITTPTQASSEICNTMKITADTSTDAERIASKEASDPEAISAPE